MPVLANARYERFAQIVADGKLTPTAAYRETLGADARDPDVNSCRWMKKPPIAKRIAELKGRGRGQVLPVPRGLHRVAGRDVSASPATPHDNHAATC